MHRRLPLTTGLHGNPRLGVYDQRGGNCRRTATGPSEATDAFGTTVELLDHVDRAHLEPQDHQPSWSGFAGTIPLYSWEASLVGSGWPASFRWQDRQDGYDHDRQCHVQSVPSGYGMCLLAVVAASCAPDSHTPAVSLPLGTTSVTERPASASIRTTTPDDHHLGHGSERSRSVGCGRSGARFYVPWPERPRSSSCERRLSVPPWAQAAVDNRSPCHRLRYLPTRHPRGTPKGRPQQAIIRPMRHAPTKPKMKSMIMRRKRCRILSITAAMRSAPQPARPAATAARAAWVRLCTPSFKKMLLICRLAVRSLINSASAN